MSGARFVPWQNCLGTFSKTCLFLVLLTQRTCHVVRARTTKDASSALSHSLHGNTSKTTFGRTACLFPPLSGAGPGRLVITPDKLFGNQSFNVPPDQPPTKSIFKSTVSTCEAPLFLRGCLLQDQVSYLPPSPRCIVLHLKTVTRFKHPLREWMPFFKIGQLPPTFVSSLPENCDSVWFLPQQLKSLLRGT